MTPEEEKKIDDLLLNKKPLLWPPYNFVSHDDMLDALSFPSQHMLDVSGVSPMPIGTAQIRGLNDNQINRPKLVICDDVIEKTIQDSVIYGKGMLHVEFKEKIWPDSSGLGSVKPTKFFGS